jgi:hypothetical protein
VGTNTVAADHHLANAHAPAITLVTAALAWRLEPPADDEATALLGLELIPLYVHYIDEHIARAGRRPPAACRQLPPWRTRLLA